MSENLKRKADNDTEGTEPTLKRARLTHFEIFRNWNDLIHNYNKKYAEMEPQNTMKRVSPIDMSRGLLNGLGKYYQTPPLSPEIAHTHYLPKPEAAEEQQRASVLRLAKGQEATVEQQKVHYNDIREIMTPPASLVDASEQQNENTPIDLSNNIKETDDITYIGPNKSAVRTSFLQHLNLKSSGSATRALLDVLFTFEVLATHSLTGKPSPAFYGRERPKKYPLDAKKVDDIIDFVSKATGATRREVRQIITAKCADSAKKYRKRFQTT